MPNRVMFMDTANATEDIQWQVLFPVLSQQQPVLLAGE